VIKVLIFEDNKHLRETFQLLLNSTDEFVCIGAYPDGNDVVKIIKNNPCDVVLMDIEMPNKNGIEATKLIKKAYPKMNILIHTVYMEDEYIFDAIRAGASGYLLKSTSTDDYLQAIRDVHIGGSPMTPGIARRVLELFRNHQPLSTPNINYNLTVQEKKVLQLLVDGKSYKMIAAELEVAIDTVKSHISNIYAKLQVHSATEAVSMAIKNRIV
jgi:DNA-binding NarL/FixJ family response regulator